MNRQSYYAESTGESTKTGVGSNTYGDKVSLTFTPDANADYVLIWSCLFQMSNTTARGSVRLLNDTDTVELGEDRGGSRDATDYEFRGGVAVYEANSSPGSHTFSIEYLTQTTAQTARIKEARIIAIKLESNDLFAQDLTDTGNNTTTFANKVSLTVPTAGDYLVLASAGIYNGDDAGDPFAIKLTDGTNNWGLHTEDNYANDGTPADGGGKYSWMTMVKQTLASSTTFRIQTRNTVGADEINTEFACIVALNLADIPDHGYAESRSRSTTTSTSAQTKVTVTDTFEVHTGVIIGVALLDHSINTSSVNAQITEGGVDIAADMVREPQLTGTNGNYVFGMMKGKTLSASSVTWLLQYFAEAGTSGIQEAALIVMQLEEDTGTLYTKTFTDDVITLTDSIVKAPHKRPIDTITFTEVFHRFTSRNWSDTITLSEVFTKSRQQFKTVIDEITLSEVFTSVRTHKRTYTDEFTLTDTIQRVLAYGKSFLDTITFTDTFAGARTYIRELSDTINLTDTLEILFNSISGGIHRLLFEDLPRSIGYLFGGISRETKPDGITRETQPDGIIGRGDVPTGNVNRGDKPEKV